MTGRYDEEIPDHDERLHLRDRGVGRDIGRNPAYRGIKPRTRQDTRALTTMESVGSWGTAEETITSMSRNSVAFIVPLNDNVLFRQTLVSGSGSLCSIGVTLLASGTLSAVTLRLINGRSNQAIHVWSMTTNDAGRGSNYMSYFGDWGVSFNDLILESRVLSGAPFPTVFLSEGVVTLASIE